MSAPENRNAACTGGAFCEAEVHIHGCFADDGRCDEPDEHDLADVDALLWDAEGA